MSVDARNTAARAAATGNGVVPTGYKVIVIEDDASDFLLLQRQFRKRIPDATVTCYTGYQEFLAGFPNSACDAIVTDLSLPDGSGIDVVRFVRANDNQLPIVVLTGNGSEQFAVEALKEGADDYLVKGAESFINVPNIISSLFRALSAERAKNESLSELNRFRARFRDFADSASDWFWEQGPDLTFSYVSEGLRDSLGIDTEPLIGKAISALFKNGPPTNWQEFEERIAARELFRDLIITMDSPLLGTRYVRLSGKPIHSETGTFAGYRGVGADITDQVENSERLAKAKKAAEEANRAKSRFLAVMSHELRTPLNAIIGFAEAMLAGVAGKIEARQHDYLQNIRAAGHELLNHVNDILDLSRIEAGRIDFVFEEFSLQEEVLFVADMVRPFAEQSKVSLVEVMGPEDFLVVADRRSLGQVLRNLMTNAVKFTEAGGCVSVSVAQDAENTVIQVSDTGIGIPEHELDRVVEPFHQVGHAFVAIGNGAGLGLSIVHGIVRGHGGRVEIKSKVGEGTTVIVTLPRNLAAGKVSTGIDAED